MWAEWVFEYDLKSFFNSFKLRHLHEVLRRDAGLPEHINQFLYSMNSRDANLPKGQAVHDSDPELAEVAVIADSLTGGMQLQRAREVERLPDGLTALALGRAQYHWSNSPLKGVPQGTNWGPLLATFFLEASGLYTPWAPPVAAPEWSAELPTTGYDPDLDKFREEVEKERVAVKKGIPTFAARAWGVIQFVDDGLYYGMGMPLQHPLLLLRRGEFNVYFEWLYRCINGRAPWNVYS